MRAVREYCQTGNDHKCSFIGYISEGGGTGVAPSVTVEAEAGAVANTGMETEYLTGTVSKYSGMNTLSVELLERSDPNFYAELHNSSKMRI
jgi:hypothetical protein